ncbi:hypothetical protein F5051DRAFT_215265 [Lentinula edodes]|nr:hypothetical protein F5051DRAFT_215265 [Lentinula edodes]
MALGSLRLPLILPLLHLTHPFIQVLQDFMPTRPYHDTDLHCRFSNTRSLEQGTSGFCTIHTSTMISSGYRDIVADRPVTHYFLDTMSYYLGCSRMCPFFLWNKLLSYAFL